MALTQTQDHGLESHLRSIEQLLELEARQYFHVTTAFEEEVGRDDAHAVISRGLRNFGRWRGQGIGTQHDRSGTRRTLTALLEDWGSADVHGVLEGRWGLARGNTERAVLRVADAPDLNYLRTAGRLDLAQLWWDQLLSGAVDGYIDDVGVQVWPDNGTLVVVVGCGADPHEQRPDAHELPYLSSAVFGHEDATLQVLRRTVDNRAAQLIFLGRAMIAEFDASGEHALRVGIQRFGAERGDQLRRDHLAAGKELNLKSLLEDFDYGGEAVWRFQDEGVLTPSQWSQNCTFCPFASVWRELDGLDLGLLYDVEFHVAQFKAYHPNIRVRWNKLQTRGDAVCEFRFDLPNAGVSAPNRKTP